MRILESGRGSATRGALSYCVAILLATLCAAGGPAAAAPRAPDVPREPLAFTGLAWDAPAGDVARALASRGFSPAAAAQGEGPAWHGEAFGRAAGLVTESDRDGLLIAVTLRFDPDSRGSALQRYARLVDAVRRRHGPWTVRVAPGRPVDEERLGHFGVVRRFGPRTAATLWTDDAGGAAAVQLDGDGVLWLRYEGPRWDAATREREDASR